MKRHIGSVVAVAAVLAVMGMYYTGWRVYPVTKDNLQRHLRNEVPIGASRAQAEAFLQKTCTDYGWMEDEQRFAGTVRNVSNAVIVRENLLISIELDSSGRVKSTAVESGLIGP